MAQKVDKAWISWLAASTANTSPMASRAAYTKTYLAIIQMCELPDNPFLEVQSFSQFFPVVFDCHSPLFLWNFVFCARRGLEVHPRLAGCLRACHSCHGPPVLVGKRVYSISYLEFCSFLFVQRVQTVNRSGGYCSPVPSHRIFAN